MFRQNFRNERFKNMSTEELRQLADEQGLAQLEARVAAGDDDPDVLNALRESRIRNGRDPDTGSDEVKKMYEMPLEELRERAQKQQFEREREELDARQSQAATTWTAYEPRYKKTPQNAQIMVNEITRRKLAGTVSDFQTVFADLAAQGKLELNVVPLQPSRLYTTDELRAMPAEQMRAVIDKMKSEGIF